MNNTNLRGDELLDPNQSPNTRRETKQIKIKQDGLMEREDDKVLTQDGRELLKEDE